jgi:dolichol kinase
MVSGNVSTFGLEVKRKSFHLIIGLTIAVLTYFSEPIFGKLIIIPILAGSLGLFILQHFKKNPINSFLVGHLERHKDASILYKGAIYYGIGASVPILLLDRFTACAIIAILSVGDAASTILGRLYGKHRPRGKSKSIEGTIAFIIFAFPIAHLFLQNLWHVTFLTLLGSIIELFSPYDDNLAIPIGLTAFMLVIQALV